MIHSSFISLSRSPRWLLVGLSSAMTLFFFAFNQNNYFRYATFAPQAEVGYNLATQNIPLLNTTRQAALTTLSTANKRATDYAEIDHATFGAPTQSWGCNDTFGYGVILGLLWKLTHSFRYRDLQLLQCLIFIALMPLVYEIFLMLCLCSTTSLCASIALLFFQPLLFLNAQLLSDVWAYYGNVLLVWTVLRFLEDKLRWPTATILGLLFGICQLARATVFFSLLTLSLLVLVRAYQKGMVRKALCFLLLLGATNISTFWVPFCVNNYMTFKQLFVSCAGHDLLVGLGEFNNPWNYIMDDGFCDNLVQQRFGLPAGTPAYHAKAQQIFWECVQEHPAYYLTTILRRLPRIVAFNPLWNSQTGNLLKGTEHAADTLLNACRSPLALLMKLWDYAVARLHYVELYLLLTWVGFCIAFYRGQRLSLAVALCLIVASISKIPSHLEQRYQVPFYWIMALFIGHVVVEVMRYKRSCHVSQPTVGNVASS